MNYIDKKLQALESSSVGNCGSVCRVVVLQLKNFELQSSFLLNVLFSLSIRLLTAGAGCDWRNVRMRTKALFKVALRPSLQLSISYMCSIRIASKLLV